VLGPGATLFEAVQKQLERLPFIAEDLGMITPDVHALRDEFHIPGTRVLQFAFDGRPDNPYLPGNFALNTVVYTGTHDNATTREWYEDLNEDQRHNVWAYMGRTPAESAEAAPALMRLAWSSIAALAIAPLQDLLNLGRGNRMNVPGQAGGNWRWRVTEDVISPGAFEWLRELTENSNRFAVAPLSMGSLEAVS
jgi:4-alpha-glucanotransferase